VCNRVDTQQTLSANGVPRQNKSTHDASEYRFTHFTFDLQPQNLIIPLSLPPFLIIIITYSSDYCIKRNNEIINDEIICGR